jgi:hypothetical protein
MTHPLAGLGISPEEIDEIHRQMLADMKTEPSLVLPDFSIDPLPTLEDMQSRGFVRRGRSTFGDELLREKMIGEFGFALPCLEAIEECIGHGPIVEVGAGIGGWASIIARNGGDIVVTDRLPTGAISGHGFLVGGMHPVEEIDAVSAVRMHPDRTVLMIWPTYGWKWAAEVLNAMVPGQKIIHIGEIGEATGDEFFADMIRGPAFERVASMEIPVWPRIHDDLEVYRKIGR